MIAVADLFEAEGRLFRQSILRLGWCLGCICIALLLSLAGLGLWLWGLYVLLTGLLGTSGAAWATGTLAIILAGGLTWMARGFSH